MADLDGFKTTSTGATGTIQEGKAVTAAFTNTKNGDVTGTGDGLVAEIDFAQKGVKRIALKYAAMKKVE